MFRNELYSVTAVDMNSKYIYTKLCQNRVQVIDHLESLRLFVTSSYCTFRVIRTDNGFVTSSTIHWARQHQIIFKTSIPFEYDTVWLVERTHRILQEMTVKSLAFKPHLSPAYWGMAYEHNAMAIIIHLHIHSGMVNLLISFKHPFSNSNLLLQPIDY